MLFKCKHYLVLQKDTQLLCLKIETLNTFIHLIRSNITLISEPVYIEL